MSSSPSSTVIMDTEHEDVLKYDGLEPGRRIRYITLEPSRDFNSMIRCRLIESSLDEARGVYEALSYVWGSQTREDQIICNDRPLYVTTNCCLALRYLRRKWKSRFLWIDAICIDQSSSDERGHQVGLMGEIYNPAKNVIIWLGEPQPGVKWAFRRTHNLHRLEIVKQMLELVGGPIKEVEWGLRQLVYRRPLPHAYDSLLDHTWFRRIWTFQELLMASHATIQCGNYTLPWDAFAERARAHCQNIEVIETTRLHWLADSVLSNDPLHSDYFHDGMRDYHEEPSFRIARSFKWIAMTSLWRNTFGRESSEPLDKFYGFYALFRQIGFDLPKPDYHKTVPQVSQELTIGIIMLTLSLMPLHSHVDRRFTSGCTSWALDWEQIDDIYAHAHYWGIERGNHSIFRAKYRPSIDGNRLVLEGILYGAMRPFGSPVPHLEPESSNERSVSWALASLMWLVEMLKLSSGFDDCPNGQLGWEAWCTAYFKGYTTNVESHRFLESMILPLLQCGMVSSQLPRHVSLLENAAPGPVLKNLHMLDKDELFAYVRDDDSMRSFAQRLTDTTRRCSQGVSFRTSGDWIGITPCPVQPGDLVALLHGSSVPAILRPVGQDYKLVCFASIQGLPDSAWPNTGNEKGVQSIVLI